MDLKARYIDPENKILNPFQRGIEAEPGDRGWAEVGMTRTIDVDAHSVYADFSTATRDRYGEIVEPSGARELIGRYLSNPVLQKDHDHSITIGSVEDLKIDKTIHGRAVFETDPDVPEGREQWALYRNKRRRAFSIGFMSVETEMRRVEVQGIEEWSRVFTLWELHENSAVSVPANFDALSKAITGTRDLLLAKDAPADGSEVLHEAIRSVLREPPDEYLQLIQDQFEKMLTDPLGAFHTSQRDALRDVLRQRGPDTQHPDQGDDDADARAILDKVEKLLKQG